MQLNFFGRIRNRLRSLFPGRSVEASVVAYSDILDEPDVEALVKDMRSDYQAAMAVLAIRSHLRQVEVAVTSISDSEDPKIRPLTEHIRDLWYRTIRDLSESIEYGRAAFQKHWRNDPERGLTLIDELEYLPAAHNGRRFSHLLLNRKGRFDGIRLTGSGKERDIPPHEAYWFGLDATTLEPYGRSIYLGAPQEVRKDRKLLFKLRRTFWKKFVLRGGVAHVEPTMLDAETGEQIDNFEATARHLEALNAGGWLIFPSTRDALGNLKNNFTSLPETLDPTPLEASIEGTDAELSRALGIHEKLLTEGSAVGAMNAVISHTGMALVMIEEKLEQMVRSFEKYVCRPHEQRNWPVGKRPLLQMTYTSLIKGESSLLVKLCE